MPTSMASSERKLYTKPDSFAVKKMRGVVAVPYIDTLVGRKFVLASIHQEDLVGKGKRELVHSFGEQLRKLQTGQLAVVSGGLDAENDPESQVVQEFKEEWGLSVSAEALQRVKQTLRILQWRNGSTNTYIDFLVSDFFLVALTEEDLSALRTHVDTVQVLPLSELLLLPEESLRPLTVAVIQTINAVSTKVD